MCGRALAEQADKVRHDDPDVVRGTARRIAARDPVVHPAVEDGGFTVFVRLALVLSAVPGRRCAARTGTPVNRHVTACSRNGSGFGFGFTGGAAAWGAGGAAAVLFERDPRVAIAMPLTTTMTAAAITSAASPAALRQAGSNSSALRPRKSGSQQ